MIDILLYPIWTAIRYDKVEILKRLLERGIEMPNEWLAYCAYSNSLKVTEELLIKQFKHKEYEIETLNTDWLKRELYKNTETSRLIKNIFYK